MMDKCECSLRGSLVGDGCRYCQPQTYIDMLVRQAKDMDAELTAATERAEKAEADAARYHEVLRHVGIYAGWWQVQLLAPQITGDIVAAFTAAIDAARLQEQPK